VCTGLIPQSPVVNCRWLLETWLMAAAPPESFRRVLTRRFIELAIESVMVLGQLRACVRRAVCTGGNRG
jgi:hypothetical protein